MKSLIRAAGSLIQLYFLSSLALALDCKPNGEAGVKRVNCTLSGEVLCMAGWSGEDCNVATCQDNCHPTHGYCTKPGECKCALGWRGKNCDECVPLPGCKQGYCKENSYDCICNAGWEGTYCSSPVCRKGCHSSRGYCRLPGECRCRIGWGGETCELCRPLPGCKNGYCTKPLECLCKKGWEGMHCNKPICQATCSKEHGSCTKPGQCRCAVGWWGGNCETCFPYPGCKHGHCNKPWECICDPGWRGMKCDEAFDIGQSYCRTHPNPCKNGGKCADMEVDQTYTCACNPLFTGEHCDFLTKPKPFYFPIFPRSSLRWQSSVQTKNSTITVLPVLTTASALSEQSTTAVPVIDASGEQDEQEDQRDSYVKEEVEEVLSDIVTSVSTQISIVTEAYPQETRIPLETSPQESTVGKISTTSIPDIEIAKEANIRSGLTRRPQSELSSVPVDYSPVIKEPGTPRNLQIRVPIIKTQSIHSNRKALRNLKNDPKGRTDVTVRKKVSPILFLQLRSPTKPFYNPLEDDPIKNTDANSPKANLITKRRRYVRYNNPGNSVPSAKNGPIFPYTSSVRLGPTVSSNPRYTANFPMNTIDPVILESIIQNSNIRSIIPARLTGSFQQRNIASKIKDELGDSDPLQHFSAHDDYETFQASSQKGVNAYRFQSFDDRFFKGDSAEIDEDIQDEDILQAFIELKKLSK